MSLVVGESLLWQADIRLISKNKHPLQTQCLHLVYVQTQRRGADTSRQCEGVWQAWKTESLLYKYFLHPSSPLRLGGVRSTGAAFSTQTNGACYWMRQAVKAWSKLLWSEQRADHPGRKQWPTVDGTAASYSSCLGCCTHWYCVHTRTYYEIKKHVDLLMPSCWEVTSATGWEGRETCTPPDGDSSLPPLEPSLQLLPSESYQLRICVRARVCV